MSENENDSFRDKNVKDKILIIIGITLLIILVAGFIFGLYFFGLAGVFKLLGVQYESIWTLVVFVISLLIVSSIFELFSKLIFILSVRNITGKTTVLIIRIIIEFTSNWLVLFTIDEFMRSITLSLKTEIIIALLIAVIEIIFDDDKDEEEDE
ncbi:YrvL family regulatory protein [Oceanobacillus sp. CFH 90083]|uniref:YrvL family regulatory protein n=1 Tax=Oceanobacillus sp. CFH 90083 TaxID=2592336 RepID=UPI00128E05EB|nr:YrvL family regulatory protein [Oceanobacillus sp. CFH 90083]